MGVRQASKPATCSPLQILAWMTGVLPGSYVFAVRFFFLKNISAPLLFQYLHRMPAQAVPGHQRIPDTAFHPSDAVMEPALSVAMSIDHLLRTPHLRHLRKHAVFLKNVRRRIMQEHNKLAVSVFRRGLKRLVQPFKFALHKIPMIASHLT